MSTVCRPCRGLLVLVYAFPRPDQVGVGYGLRSLRDYQQEGTSALLRDEIECSGFFHSLALRA